MNPKTVDIGQVLDGGAYTGFQKRVFILAALAIVMDGFDGQLIGYAIPTLLQEWGLSRNDFAPTVAVGLVGMGLGSAFAGFFADRYGRRWAVILSVLTFGVATGLIGLAENLMQLTVLRFLAGLGIGGALPTATTLTAEFTPSRRRTLAITATIVCVPLGGMLSGLFASQVIPLYGWRWLFFGGGLLSLVLLVVLYRLLPESPRFLVRHPERASQLRQIMAKMGHHVPDDVTFTDQIEQEKEARSGVGALFANGLGRDTLTIWLAFFMCLLTIYAAFSWLPTMLSAEGLSVSVASSGLAAYNMGGVLGALGCALLVTRFGSRIPLLICCAGGAISAFLLLGIDVTRSSGLLIFGIGVHGLFTNAVQSVMYPLCAYVYPTKIRATGTAMALVWGRLGTVVSAFAGAVLITLGGLTAYVIMLGVAMLLVLLALAFTRNHIPARIRNE
ncbi:MAG: MFS transporter [Neisseriaceae bacterium]|nr:MFS transporter [Neisseriaceae bacterium]